jgi:hypothetical protein
MQTGDRLSYHPETAFAELRDLPAKLASLTKLIEDMRATQTSPASAVGRRDSQQIENYNRLIDSALAHIADIGETLPEASINTISTH